VDALGQILGGPGLGLVAENVSVAGAILAAALLLAPSLALFGRTLRQRAVLATDVT